MRRRAQPPAGLLFQGKRYLTAAEVAAARDAWMQRRQRLLALIERDEAEAMSGQGLIAGMEGMTND